MTVPQTNFKPSTTALARDCVRNSFPNFIRPASCWATFRIRVDLSRGVSKLKWDTGDYKIAF